MKEEIVKHVLSMKKELYNISKYLYENPEESFHEHKAIDYLTDILKNNNFEITKGFLDIPTAFIAKFGNGHPKICYICEYDCPSKDGHIVGSNLVSSMSIGAAIGLSKVISKTHGTVIVLGCPGEFLGGSKVVMAKQGVFDDIDVVLTAHPSILNANCNSSPAVLPINITYNYIDECNANTSFTPFDACLFTLNSINAVAKGYSKNCSIDKISINGNLSRSIEPNTVITNFYIKAPNIAIAEEIKNKICSMADHLYDLMDIKATVSLLEVPYENFTSNTNLSRIFSHNLKEAGIIDLQEDISLPYGISLGDVCSLVPSLRYLVKISENSSIQFASKEFAAETLSAFAQKQVLDMSSALALTGFDLIDNENLLKEIKEETFDF